MSTTQRIGFGKKIRLVWLTEALKLRAAGSNFDHARTELESLIAITNPGKDAIRKVMTNIKQVIFQPVERNREHFHAGITYGSVNNNNTFCIAWGLSITSYSFVAASAETVGRLLKVQSNFAAAEMGRRLAERVGERDFVKRVARYNLSSFLDWGIVNCDEKKMLYSRGKIKKITDAALLAWLIESVLLATGRSEMPFSQALSSLMLFPFEFEPMPASLIVTLNSRLQLSRQNLNDEHIELCERHN
jgi:hypothetical protein